MFIHPFVTLGIEEEFKEFEKITLTTLNSENKYEIMRQVFTLFDNDFNNMTSMAVNFLNYHLIFSYTLSQQQQNEINDIVLGIAVGIYLKCHEHKLFVSQGESSNFFPYFLEKLNGSTCILRSDYPFKNTII